jgi:hypothetical protein
MLWTTGAIVAGVFVAWIYVSQVTRPSTGAPPRPNFDVISPAPVTPPKNEGLGVLGPQK